MPLIPDPVALRHLREAAGLSQAALAERAGLTEKTIARIESGITPRIRPSTLAQIAKALGCAREALLLEPPARPGAATAPASTSSRTPETPRSPGPEAPPSPAAETPPSLVPTTLPPPWGSRIRPEAIPPPPQPVTASVMDNIRAAFRAYNFKRFAITARLRKTEPLTDEERVALGCHRKGTGARFEATLGPGPTGRRLTVYSTDADTTLALHEHLERRAVVALVVALRVCENGFDHVTVNSESDIRIERLGDRWHGFPSGRRGEMVPWTFTVYEAESVAVQGGQGRGGGAGREGGRRGRRGRG